MKGLKLAFLLFICCCIASCNFHLRGSTPLPPQLKTLFIQSDDPYGQLTLELKQILRSADVTLVNTAEQAPYTLKIFEENYNSTVLSESASSETKQYVLHYSLKYQLATKSGTVIYGPSQLNEERNYTVNENQVLSIDTQQATLKQEMQNDMVFRMLTQLSSAQARSALSAAP